MLHVMVDLGGLGAVLSQTPLSNAHIMAATERDDILLLRGLEQRPEALVEAWRTARSLVDSTSRWPVLVDAKEPSFYVYDDEDEVARHRQAAPIMDPWPVLDPPVEPYPIDLADLRSFVPALSGIDLEAEARGRLSFPVAWTDLDRWVYDRLLSHPDLASEALAYTDCWVRENISYWPQETALALLPASEPWMAAHWLYFFGAAGQESALIAAMWQWHQAWGAEIVASWGTMLEFFVSAQPDVDEQAWRLACQLKALGGNLEMDRWELALALTRSHAWFVHSRP